MKFCKYAKTHHKASGDTEFARLSFLVRCNRQVGELREKFFERIHWTKFANYADISFAPTFVFGIDELYYFLSIENCKYLTSFNP